MDKYQETFNTWNNIAKVYENKFMDLNVYNHTYDYICQTITKAKAKLLDVGCGPGNITKYLLSKRPDFNILGIDIASNMVELATKNNPSANFAVMDNRDIAKLDTSFDGVIGGFCLPYLSQKECNVFISSTYNLLNTNGLIYLSFVEGEPNESNFKSNNAGRVFFYFHKLMDLKHQLKKARFSNIKTFRVEYKGSEIKSEPHTILMARKL
ncbi:class I SAM-dependent methyltransferase [Aestuariivivens marinum]|uniref:class I SAM-dependent methyltransferase n=1 Tax=Aestuariivivens marinum TaxID=2913555 RepID=UPI001F55D6CC|nr:class I SAM-dependent methyltransferase [Aestuariivivens marinum]